MSNLEKKNKLMHPFLKGLEKSTIFPNLTNQAVKKLETIGFPDRKTEEWKYTSVRNQLKSIYLPEKQSKLENIDIYDLPELNGPKLVFENGVINNQLSCYNKYEGLDVKSFKECSLEIKNILGNISNRQQDPFSLFNLTFLQNGFYIKVESEKCIKPIVHIIHINTSEKSLINTRLLIHVESFSEVKFVQSFINNEQIDAFVNHVTELKIDKNSNVSFDKIQEVRGENHICSEYVEQASSSSFKINTISTKGKLIRNGLNVYVNGQECDTVLNGLFFTSLTDHIDNHTLIEHIKPNCFSSECYKGIINDKSSGVFNGKVIVHEDAQKIMAYQQNSNILLSKDAKINSKPELEIYADDVKCSHGSTTGQFDKEALFYLRSRGISKDKAVNMLIEGFVLEITDMIMDTKVKNNVLKKLDIK